MMGIVKTFTKQYRRTPNSAPLTPMSCHSTNEAMTCAEEDISISIEELRESIENVAVYSQRNMRGERHVFIEDMSMDIVVVRHRYCDN
jgi:hypothetical protein